MKIRHALFVLIGFVACCLATHTAEAKKTKKSHGAPPAPRTEDDAVTPAVKDPGRHAQFLERIKKGPVGLLFLGDSITDFWPRTGPKTWETYSKYDAADFGIGGDRTEHVLWRITNGELDGIDPKVVVVMIGTNNLGMGDKPEWAAAGVKKIVDTVHEKLPKAKVLLLAIFPRDTKDSGLRKAVNDTNDIISKLGDGKQTVYLDFNEKFLGADGNIPSDVMGDRLHPSAKGYDIWHDAMQPTLDKLWDGK